LILPVSTSLSTGITDIHHAQPLLLVLKGYSGTGHQEMEEALAKQIKSFAPRVTLFYLNE
jgi:hypothetical protein